MNIRFFFFFVFCIQVLVYSPLPRICFLSYIFTAWHQTLLLTDEDDGETGDPAASPPVPHSPHENQVIRGYRDSRLLLCGRRGCGLGCSLIVQTIEKKEEKKKKAIRESEGEKEFSPLCERGCCV